jgi:hypothetical protein
VQGHGSKMAFGRCMGKPHAGHQGQWPFKRHTCRAFRSLSDTNRTCPASDNASSTSVAWICQACTGDDSLSHDQFLKHLLEVHSLDPRGIKGEKSLISHMDAADQCLNIYSWKIGEIGAVQTVCTPRRRKR